MSPCISLLCISWSRHDVQANWGLQVGREGKVLSLSRLTHAVKELKQNVAIAFHYKQNQDVC